MNSPAINFQNLRIHAGSVNIGFEELTRQIVIAENYSNTLKIEHRGPGADGGVEVLIQFDSGSAWGWQSKWFIDGFGSNETAQLKKSFKSAIKNFANLEKYIVAIPRNLSDAAKGRQHTQQKHWDSFVKWAHEFVSKKSRSIELELWDETFFVSRLQLNDPHHIGMRHYWFSSETLSRADIRQKLQKALDQIQDRYSPEFHVDLMISRHFHTLRRSSEFLDYVNEFAGKVSDMRKTTLYLVKDNISDFSELGHILDQKVVDIQKALAEINFENADIIDLSILDQFIQTFGSCDELNQLSELCKEKREIEELAKSDDDNSMHAIGSQVGFSEERLSRLRSQYYDISDYFDQNLSSLLSAPYLLLNGEAGSGKSHLLADEVKKHIDDDQTGFFIPGQNISNPLKAEEEILNYLDFPNLKFNDFLGTLSALSHADGKPILFAIDAINESDRMERWVEAIPKLVSQFKHFPNICLVISCRSDYRPICIPEQLASFTEIEHYGFGQSVGDAAKIYLDKHGIERPSAPIFGLEREFNNPLFLSTCVKAIKNEGKSIFPSEIDSFPNLLKYWLSSIETNLVRRGFKRIQKGDRKLEKVIFALAEEMTLNLTEYVPFEKANEICEKIIGLSTPSTEDEKTINHLLSEGVLIDRIAFDNNEREITFTFQKFTDYFVADAIIRLHGTRENLANGLSSGGEFSGIFDSTDENYYFWSGLRQAILSLIPLNFKCEPTDLVPNFHEIVEIPISDYLKSIPWRKSNITNDTKSILVGLLEQKENGHRAISFEDWFDLLMELALTADCPLNANYLFNKLSKQSMAERDAVWSSYVSNKTYAFDDVMYPNIKQLIDWAWVAPKGDLPVERIELAATCLGLLFTTYSRIVRDQATKALSSLFIKFPEVIEPILEKFCNFNDDYVRERIYAAAYGSMVYIDDANSIKKVGAKVLQNSFKSKFVECHATTRRYAQLIVELAKTNGLKIDDIGLTKTESPYTSEAISHWPTLDDIRGFNEEMNSVVWSVIGHLPDKSDTNQYLMPGDFGKYTISPESFLQSKISDGKPVSRKDVKDRFWQTVRDETNDELVELTIELYADLSALKAQQELLSRRIAGHDKKVKQKTSELSKEIEALTIQFKQSEDLLLSQLSDRLKDEYETDSMYPVHGDSKHEKFSSLQAQCWIVNRVKELGWKKDIHGKIERHGGGRREHQVERIGKKYQWIAYEELVAYLQDYHWHSEWSEEPKILERLEEFKRTDIDPSFLASPKGLELSGLDEDIPTIILKEPIHGTADENIKWTETDIDLPDPTKFIVKERMQGGEWWIVSNHLNAGDDDSSDGFEQHSIRETRFHLTMLIIPKGRESELLNAMKNPDTYDHNEYYFHEGDPDYLYGQFSYLASDKDFYPKFDHKIYEVPVMSPTMNYSTNERQYDYSGTKDYSNFQIPNWPLLEGLKLKPQNSHSKVFCNDNQTPVFVDNSEHFYGGSSAIRGDILRKFLNENELNAVWRVHIEKDGGFGSLHSRKDKFNRETFAGLHWQTDGEWFGEVVHKVGEH